MSVYFIAEAGVNHNGQMELAHQLIDIAAQAGADAVKFQTFQAKDIVTESADMAGYQKKNTGTEISQFELLKNLELSEENFFQLRDYSISKKIEFLSSAFDLNSLGLIDRLGVRKIKIPSGEITNQPYLEKIAGFAKEAILSTGMATKDEIQEALNCLVQSGLAKDKITVLHCTTNYPARPEEINLRAMLDIKETFGVEIGYSDHSEGLEVSLAAVALGAKVIEKHFTIDRKLPGPDHQASLEPAELRKLISQIRVIESATSGSGTKEPTKSEEQHRLLVRKSLVANRALQAGEKINEKDISIKRPGSGISPMRLSSILGRKLKRAVKEDEVIQATDFEDTLST